MVSKQFAADLSQIEAMPGELRRSSLASLLSRLYERLPGRARAFIRRRIASMEGGEMLSATLRDLFAVHHGVTAGAHSYGCFDPGRFGPALSIGRFVSIGPGVRIFRRNHPLERISLHPYFYGTEFGLCTQETLLPAPLRIDHDVWIGANALILPGCRAIGLGAVIGAGSVVTKDIPEFAIYAGNPARLLRYRFSEEIRNRIVRSQWWRRDRAALAPLLPQLQAGASAEIMDQFELEIARA